MRIPQYLELLEKGHFRAGAEFEIVRESAATLTADAHWGLGQVQAHRLLDHLIPKAREIGLAAGGLSRCGHTGRLGEYAERCAVENLVFIGTVNSHGAGRRIAPPGGIDGRISTNPLCMGVPTERDPLVLDMGTSVVSEGKVRVYFQKGERIPEGWILDADGKPTTDPGALYREPMGTILPLGGSQAYKGFGLGLMLDALAGGLSGGMCSQPGAEKVGGNAVFFMLIDPDRFAGREHFIREVTSLAEFVRNCPTSPGSPGIQLPGDPERSTHVLRSNDGIFIPDGVWQKLTQLAGSKGVEVPNTQRGKPQP
jgi:uncharacterized oxidoreductase